ncbi:hypothetical protein WDW89_04100 [Deltaproteobacteria bacterium TL4]
MSIEWGSQRSDTMNSPACFQKLTFSLEDTMIAQKRKAIAVIAEKRKTIRTTKALISVTFFDRIGQIVKERKLMSKEIQTGLIASTKAIFTRRKDDQKAVFGELVGNDTALGKSRIAVLKKDPLNVAARLDLIEHYVKQDTVCTLEVLREVYINALFAASQELLSSRAVNYALLAQKNYLTKLKVETTQEGRKIKEHLDAMQGTRSPEERGLEQQLTRQYKERVEIVNFLNECLRILPPRKCAKEVQINYSEFLTSDEKKLVGGQTNTRQGPIQNMNSLLRTAIYLPPISSRYLEISDGMQKKYKDLPIGALYKSKIYKLHAVIAQAGFQKEKRLPSGDINPQQLQQRQKEYINKAMKVMTNAIGLIPDLPKEQLEITCIEEYGVLILEFNRMFPTVNIVEHLKKAVVLLSKIINSENKEQVEELQERINRILEGS